jgi:hypothetical protein
MPIDPGDYAEANTAFREQIAQELQRATAALNRIATLLRAGLADPQLLREFRQSVDRVREAGWIVQQSLDSEQRQEVGALLFAHRARAVISLLKYLQENLPAVAHDAAVPVPELLKSVNSFLDSARSCGLLQAGNG